MKVFKFGGASVKNTDAVKNVGAILSLYPGEKIVIVVSAMGKTTNKLEEIVAALQAKNEKQFNDLVDELYEYHQFILGELFNERHFKIFQIIDSIFEKLKLRIKDNFSDNYSFEYDQVVSLGEVLSSHILLEYLLEQAYKATWLDARKLIRTDSNFQEGKVDWETTSKLVSSAFDEVLVNSDLVITQGFIGHTAEGFATTLGREGSDYTAGILAYCGNAESVTIWKDVPGMLNADPKYFEDTKKLEQISFKEAIELSYYGASVIHPKTIKPLQNKNIPLYVKSFLDPIGSGTKIQAETNKDELIPSFIIKQKQLLISITPKDFSFIAEENLAVIFNILSLEQIKINLMQNSALSFSILVDENQEQLTRLLSHLAKDYTVKYNENLSLVTIRHYDDATIALVTKDKESILTQKTRQTIRLVLQ
jgi:aspartate kinase